MNYIRLGNSGLKISELTFGSALTIGTENSSLEYAQALVDKAWELGIRSFDTSNNYGYGEAEMLLGKALRKYPRHQYVLSTKGSWPIGESVYERGLSRKHILWTIEESIKRLGLDYVDIYYAHRYDPEVPIEEVVRTYNMLIEQGRIRYWATSEWPLDALQECIRLCDQLNMEKPITEQFIYSFALQKAVTNGVYSFCKEHGIGTLGFSPLCQGFLTGKYRKGVPEESRIAKGSKLNYDKTINFYNQNKERIDSFMEVCERYHVDYTAAALQWCIKQSIYPVFGASKIEQIELNVQALNVEITDAFWEELIHI
jgi:aryl-alcohol dehydrogenase-like predicted oxidoreductase